jgi:hypothetical protein
MNVFVFSKNTALKPVFPKTAEFLDIKMLSAHSPENGDMTYLNVLGLSDDELKKALVLLKKNCKDKPWGIIDPKDTIKDIADLFFKGACDYLGSGILKLQPSVDLKRIKEAVQWHKKMETAVVETDNGKSPLAASETSFLNSGIKLPSEKTFPGWKKMQTGQEMPFYLLYCSLQGKIPLDTRLNDKAIAQVHKRFLDFLEDTFIESDGLLWMNSGKDCLFLIPPKAKCIEAAIKASIGMIISAPLIVLETLDINVQSNFIFALHYGSLAYKPPGKTGTVVSDAINFIFHLGTKKAMPGRLTVSGELPDKTISPLLEDCFCSAGSFENCKIWHTKKFSYAKPWF